MHQRAAAHGVGKLIHDVEYIRDPLTRKARWHPASFASAAGEAAALQPSSCCESASLLRRAVPDAREHPGLVEIARHVSAHGTQTYEACPHLNIRRLGKGGDVIAGSGLLQRDDELRRVAAPVDGNHERAHVRRQLDFVPRDHVRHRDHEVPPEIAARIA